MSDADAIARKLDFMRADIEEPGSSPAARLIAGHAALLLAAVEAVLELHVRQDKPVRSWDQPCATHIDIGRWLPLRERAAMFAAIRSCPDCRYTERYACALCRHECPDNDTWPCPTVEAITTALTGNPAGDEPRTRPSSSMQNPAGVVRVLESPLEASNGG